MELNLIEKLLYQRYIEPTKRKKNNYIGIEIEIPILNLNKDAVDFNIVHKVTNVFLNKFSFEKTGIDDEGNIYSAINVKSGDILSYDCSYNNLELSFGKELELYTIQKRFNEYYCFLKNEFNKYNYTLTGMGVNPYHKYNNNVPIPNGRYRMLFHHLNSYKNYDLPMYFHKYPRYGTFSSASQVQLDVEYEDLPLIINTFSKLEPIKAVLFSNSVLLDDNEDLLCCRDMFWENSTHGINPHNIGMFDYEFNNAEEILSYIKSTSIYCVEKGDKYINFSPINIMDYFKQDEITGEYYDGNGYKKIKFKPEYKDIEYLRSFKFEDLTFRGTIEFRSVCCQPIKDSMTVAAFHIGIMDKLNKVKELLDKDYVIYHQGYTASELRKELVKRKLPSFIDEEKLYQLAEKILDIAKEGLSERGCNEQVLLEHLYERVRNKTNPARKMLDAKDNGTDLENIIKEYGEI